MLKNNKGRNNKFNIIDERSLISFLNERNLRNQMLLRKSE